MDSPWPSLVQLLETQCLTSEDLPAGPGSRHRVLIETSLRHGIRPNPRIVSVCEVCPVADESQLCL